MDLALDMGRTVAELSGVMEEHEFSQWMIYANKKMLPTRRLELHLAQISLVIARTMGSANNAKLSDFLFDRLNEAKDITKVASNVVPFIGVRRLGQGRKVS